MHRVSSALGFVRTLPNTILGHLLGLLTFQVPRNHGGALSFDRRGPRGATWLLARMHHTATTLGFVIAASVPWRGACWRTSGTTSVSR